MTLPQSAADDTLGRLHRGALDQARLVYGVGAVLVTGVSAMALQDGRAPLSPEMVLQSLGLALAAFASADVAPLPWRRVGVVLGQLTFALAIFSAYGPLFGAGLFTMGTLVVTSFLVGRRGALVVWAVLAATIVVTLLGTGTDWGLALLAHRAVRLRMAIAACVGPLTVVLLMGRVMDSLAAAVAENTRRQLAEAEREKFLAALRLDALGRLAGGVAHDFNNSLAVIRAGFELLEGGDDPDGAIAADVQSALGHASATARQLLVFARQGPERGGAAVAERVVAQVADAARSLLPANVRVTVDVAPCPPVAMDAEALSDVLVRLITNAHEALPGGGALSMGCRRAGDGGVAIWVADDGPGMPVELQRRVFEPFFTTKADPDGRGLGLAAVWGAVTRWGGKVTLDSAPGAGTRVTLELPTAPDGPSR